MNELQQAVVNSVEAILYLVMDSAKHNQFHSEREKLAAIDAAECSIELILSKTMGLIPDDVRKELFKKKVSATKGLFKGPNLDVEF